MKCIVIDDDKLTRMALSKLIEQRPDFKLIGEYSDALSAIPAIKNDKIDLIFLDMVIILPAALLDVTLTMHFGCGREPLS